MFWTIESILNWVWIFATSMFKLTGPIQPVYLNGFWSVFDWNESWQYSLHSKCSFISNLSKLNPRSPIDSHSVLLFRFRSPLRFFQCIAISHSHSYANSSRIVRLFYGRSAHRIPGLVAPLPSVTFVLFSSRVRTSGVAGCAVSPLAGEIEPWKRKTSIGHLWAGTDCSTGFKKKVCNFSASVMSTRKKDGSSVLREKKGAGRTLEIKCRIENAIDMIIEMENLAEQLGRLYKILKNTW